MPKKLKIVFAGTPEIARLCLLSILDAGFNVELVLTQPDRPAGRGMKLTSSPVKELALEREIEVFQPATFKQNPDALAKIKAINPDIIVVVAYGLRKCACFIATKTSRCGANSTCDFRWR